MAYFYQDWKDKKMTVEVDGQFMLNFAENQNFRWRKS